MKAIVLLYPVLPLAACYVVGILAGDLLSLPLMPLFAGGFALGLGAFVFARLRVWCITALLMVAGALNHSLQVAIISPYDLRRVATNDAEYVTLRGTLQETPFYRVVDAPGNKPDFWRTLARLEVTHLCRQATNWTPAVGRVVIGTTGQLPPGFYGGQTVEIRGVMAPPPGPVAEGLFDYPSYLRRQGIYYQLRADGTNAWTRLSAATVPLADRFTGWAKATLARGLPVEDDPLRLLWAMTLGWKTALHAEVAEPFMRAGTMHVFAISGLHITFIAAFFVILLRLANLPRGWCGLIVIPVIWGYTIVTGSQASAVRSTIMSTVVVLGWALRRPHTLLNSLLMAGFAILLWDTQQLFQAGFQLSFAVVLSLALTTPILTFIQEQSLRPDPFLPYELRPHWQRAGWRAVDYLAAAVVVSLASWLGAAPLTAYYFHVATPVSLLANVLVVPLSSLALGANQASLLVGAWCPPMAELLNHSAWFLMSCMMRLSEWAAHVPGGVFHVRSPGPVFICLYYLAVISGLMLLAVKVGASCKPEEIPKTPIPVPGEHSWWRQRKGQICLAGSLGTLASLWTVQAVLESSPCEITVLPLQAGHAVYCKESFGKADWLIDCGDERLAQLVTKSFLQAQGVDRLNHFVLTHGDQQHVGGADIIRELFNINTLHHSAVRFRSRAYRDVIAGFQAGGQNAKVLQAGDASSPWQVLHPDARQPFSQADDNAMVLLGNIGGFRVMLLSDLGRRGQSRLLENHPDLKADIVVVGTRGPNTIAVDFLAAVQPRLLVVADSSLPPSAQRTSAVFAPLAARGIAVLDTRDTGAITFTFKKGECRIRAMRHLPASLARLVVDAPLEVTALPNVSEPDRSGG